MFNRFGQLKCQQQAREWFLRLQDDGTVSGDTFYQFNCWLEKPENEKAYQSIQQTEAALKKLKHTKEGQLLQRHANGLAETAPKRLDIRTLIQSRLLQGGFATAFAIGCMAIVFAFNLNKEALQIEYATAVAETREFTLGDGSHITLTPQTKIHVSLNAQRREVTLLSGHAFFNVAKDQQRPFTVHYKNYSVVVTGTIFTVNTKREEFAVNVDEGKVVVNNSGKHKRTQRLIAGQAIQAKNGNLGEVILGNENQLSLWKSGILVYRDVPLDQILKETNTYTLEQIFPATQQLGKTEISLSINISQLDELTEILEALLPVKAIKAEYGKIMLVSYP